MPLQEGYNGSHEGEEGSRQRVVEGWWREGGRRCREEEGGGAREWGVVNRLSAEEYPRQRRSSESVA